MVWPIFGISLLQTTFVYINKRKIKSADVMPYSKIEDLPDPIKFHLPKKAQQIYKSTFNSAYEKYDEVTAHKVAWSAVKKKFKKDGKGNWIANN